MRNYKTNEIKNIALLGSAGSGKTTLAEAMMFEGGVIDRRGEVASKNTVSDYHKIEHQYESSIYSTVLYTEFLDKKLNIIDTPGLDDFCGGVITALRASDTGIIVINAQHGVEVGTDIMYRYCSQHGKPVIFAINQLDSEKANYENTIDTLKANYGANKVITVQYPISTGEGFDAIIDVLLMKMYKFKGDNGEREILDIPKDELDKANELHNILVEAAAENDEALMELYFDKGTLNENEMRKGISAGMAQRGLFPIFCISARKNIGTKRLMEFIINVAPYPNEVKLAKTEKGEEISCDSKGPVSLFVFKTSIEDHVGEISYFKVRSGTLTEGDDLINSNTQAKERMTQLFVVAGKNRVKVSQLEAGDIGAAVKLKNTKTNNTLNSPGNDWKYEAIKYPNPKFRTAIKTVKDGEEEKLSEVLTKMHGEDPTIVVEYSKELKQVIVSGQGEHHLNILKSQMANDYKLETEFIAPKIPYRETITKVAQATYRHKKQSGGAGQFGEVHMVIEPFFEDMPKPTVFKVNNSEIKVNVKHEDIQDLPWGGKLVFYNCIVGGVIDNRFMPAILKGIMEKMEEGPLTGSYARDIRVALYDGKMHPVDSNEISFKLAGRQAFREAFKNAGPKIMEPIYNVEVRVPSDYMGDVMSDLQTRRAVVQGMSSEKGFEVIKARVPLAEMNKYSTALSSITGGRAMYSMEYAEYSQVPSDIQEKLLKAYEEVEE
ncbi:MAG: elongation factor G [Bacteroidales bacterium]|nr:elongation factor G [Bacteroidales bacterium]